MRAPFSESPSHFEWGEGLITSNAPDICVYPTDDDDDWEEPEPALDAKGNPLRYRSKPAFGFGRR